MEQILCKCGAEARPNQRTCAVCHKQGEQGYRKDRAAALTALREAVAKRLAKQGRVVKAMRLEAIRIAAQLLEAEADWTFTTEVRYRGNYPSVNVWGLPDNEMVDDARGTVKWSVEFEVRHWGIKEINPHVEAVDMTVTVEDADTEEVKDVHVQYPHVPEPTKGEEDTEGYLKTLDKGWKLEWKLTTCDVIDRGGLSLGVSEVELDFQKRIIKVEF